MSGRNGKHFSNLLCFSSWNSAEGKEAQRYSQDQELHREAVPEEPEPRGSYAAVAVRPGGSEINRQGTEHGEDNTRPGSLVQ